MRIGIDIGGSHIAVGLVNRQNNIVKKIDYNWTLDEKLNLTESSKKYCSKLINQILKENNVLDLEKIGIGYPNDKIINGIINSKNKLIDIPTIISNEFKVPVYLKNDVKCSATCEKNIGNLKKFNNCIFMTLGTGIGGAYFYKNKLVIPNKYQGFEIGHMIIKIDGKKCRCGEYGCFEAYASMQVFRKEIEELFNIEKLTSNKMFELIENKQKLEEIDKIVDNYLDYLSIGLCNIINIFEPDAICIGGSFAHYEPLFMEKLRLKLKRKFDNREIPEILTAKYGNDAGIIGAAMIESN